MTMEWLRLLGGGLLLYFGAEWSVGGAWALALALRVPQILVGLTVVAYGTSAPEIIVGVEAAGAGYGDVAIGNVVGSNIFNVLLCLGAAGLASPLRAPLADLSTDLIALGVMTVLAAAFIRTERHVSRTEGLVALTLYGGFTVLVIARG